MLSKQLFGRLKGEDVFLFQLTIGDVAVEIMNYGCTIVSILTPDRKGNKQNIVAGFRHLSDYAADHPYFGCVVGRFANRIAGGRFTLDGKTWQLSLNDGVNHLHGGFSGFNRKVWQVESMIDSDEQCGVTFSYFSRDGEEGYPGNLRVFISYRLTNENCLIVDYRASTDKPTIVSLSNHSYFNLSGFVQESISDHYLKINADYYTVKNENNTPSGVIERVRDTPFDFTTSKPIGQYIGELTAERGYDHNYVLNNNRRTSATAASLYEPFSGRLMTVYTNMPGMQLYTANWWDGTLAGYHGNVYHQHSAVALETQAFPDAPNQPGFPSAVLRPGELYAKTTSFHFQTANQPVDTG
ncbi:aldose epimerase family protein [Flavisolibacter nicotianae]|uniref:aldose epimerase family protein n=1 Tax=Flavisolibacter nicotianae TaxID=2364882 RepID=UPI000EB2F3F2|nr:aldose epimerase family protein [Flavisolibacter nicotianae]